MTMEYTKSPERTVEVGGLRFVVMHRELKGGDGGPTIEVLGPVSGQIKQVLRFDCFRKAPHYHMPSDDQKSLMLDAKVVGNGVEWSLTQIRTHMPEMLATAGYTDLSRQVDRAALAKDWTKVRDAVKAVEPAVA